MRWLLAIGSGLCLLAGCEIPPPSSPPQILSWRWWDGPHPKPRCGSVGPCRFLEVPRLVLNPCDTERHAVTIELELIAMGERFTGRPDRSVTGSSFEPGGDCSRGELPTFDFLGLRRDEGYALAVRVRDAEGELWSEPEAMERLGCGWALWGRLFVGDCGTQACGCSGPRQQCSIDSDCCSARCVGFTCE